MPVSLYVFLCFFLPCFFFVWKFIASLQREALSYVLLAFSLLLCALWNIWGTVLLAALMAVMALIPVGAIYGICQML